MLRLLAGSTVKGIVTATKVPKAVASVWAMSSVALLLLLLLSLVVVESTPSVVMRRSPMASTFGYSRFEVRIFQNLFAAVDWAVKCMMHDFDYLHRYRH